MILLAVKIPIFIKLGGETEAFLLLAVGIPIFKLDGEAVASVSLYVWKGKEKERARKGKEEKEKGKEGKGKERETKGKKLSDYSPSK